MNIYFQTEEWEQYVSLDFLFRLFMVIKVYYHKTAIITKMISVQSTTVSKIVTSDQ